MGMLIHVMPAMCPSVTSAQRCAGQVPATPAPRDGHATAYDSWRNADFCLSNDGDLWSWEGERWEFITGPWPGGGGLVRMSFDSTRGFRRVRPWSDLDFAYAIVADDEPGIAARMTINRSTSPQTKGTP